MTRLLFALTLIALHCASSFAHASGSKSEKWEQKYAQLLKDRPDIKRKVDGGQATKEQVIKWLMQGGDRKRSKRKYYAAKVAVMDPAGFQKSQEEMVYSGPQPGEKLPAFQATGLRGKRKDDKYNPVAVADGKPLVLIFQDNSVVGKKGLLLAGPALARIAEESPVGLHVSATFLVDDPAPSQIIEYDFMDKISDVIQMSVSPDRRDGPGTYGLNRNVAMTIIVAKNGKVLNNFAFIQPMLYPDPHVLGAIAEAIGKDRQAVAGWLNRTQPNKRTSKDKR